MSTILSSTSLKKVCTPTVLRCVSWRRLLSQATSPQARVAVVTGASSGIGRAVALRLADDGYNLALNDLHSTESSLDQVRAAIANKGRRVFVSTGDVAKEEDVKRLVAGSADELGSVDVVSVFLFCVPFRAFLNPGCVILRWSPMPEFVL